ncbi:uncharacterized protein LOC143927071 [Lithobates pipiens]
MSVKGNAIFGCDNYSDLVISYNLLQRYTLHINYRFESLMTASKTPTECCKLLEVAKESFLQSIRKAQNEEALDISTKCDIIYYLEAVLVLKHLQRPGVVRNMTINEWEKRVHHRYVSSENTVTYTIIGVQLHKTATNQVAAFALEEEEEMWFKVYYEKVRPTLLKGNTQKKEFFVSTSGHSIYNVSNDIHRHHKRFTYLQGIAQESRESSGLVSGLNLAKNDAENQT